MANRNHEQHGSDKPNVSSGRVKTFQRSRLYLQLVTIFAIALAFCLGVSIFLKVDTITVSGTEHYTAWTVAQASGIQEGDNLLFFGRASAMVKIKQALPYVKDVRIGISLPGTVNIVVVEVPVVYAIKSSDGSWWLMTSDGKLMEKTNGATAGQYTASEGVLLQDPKAGEKAVAWEETAATDEVGQVIQTATKNRDRLEAALLIAQQLERYGMLGVAASIHVEALHDLRLWYGDRYEVQLGDSVDMDMKIYAVKSAVEQMGEFQTGALEVLNTDGKWQVIYRQR